jgi:superfamily II DNA or RNA helicase
VKPLKGMPKRQARKNDESDSEDDDNGAAAAAALDAPSPGPSAALDTSIATVVSTKDASKYSDFARELFRMCKDAKLAMSYLLMTRELRETDAARVGLGAGVSRQVLPGANAQPRYLTGGTLKQHQRVSATVKHPSCVCKRLLTAIASLCPSLRLQYGVSWLLAMHYSQFNAILADDMGLGKTVQVIAYLAQLLEWFVDDHAAAIPVDLTRKLLTMTEREYTETLGIGGRGSRYKESLPAIADKGSPDAWANKLAEEFAWLDEIDGAQNASSAVSAAADASVTDDRTSTLSALAKVASGAVPGVRIKPLPDSASAKQHLHQAQKLAVAASSGPEQEKASKSSKGKGVEEGAASSNALRLADRMRLVQASIEASERATASSAPVDGAAAPVRAPVHVLPSILPDEVFEDRISGLAPVLSRGSVGPHLVVVPSSTLTNWQREFNKWCPLLRVVTFAGSKEDRRAVRSELASTNVVLTSYAALERGDALKHLSVIDWQVMVLDEAHVVKNSNSARFNNLMALRARRRLLLTGTPVQNNIAELVALLRFVIADVFVPANCDAVYSEKEEADWDNEGSNKRRRGSAPSKAALNNGTADDTALLVHALQKEISAMVAAQKRQRNALAKASKASKAKQAAAIAAAAAASTTASEEQTDMTSAISDILSVFILRRAKESVGLQLPPKIRITQWIKPTALQAMITATLHAVVLGLSAPSSLVANAVKLAIDNDNKAAASSPSSADVQSPASAESIAQIKAHPNRAIVIANLTDVFAEDASTTGNGAVGLPDDRDAESAAATAGGAASSGAIGRLLMMMRKAAIHPLMLRVRYTNAACLALAKLLHTLDAEADSAKSSTAEPEAKRRAIASASGTTPHAVAATPSAATLPVDPLEMHVTDVPLGNGAAVSEGSSSSGVTAGSSALLPLSVEGLRALASWHTKFSQADLLSWANGDKVLADIAKLLLGSSDFDVHRAAMCYGSDSRMRPFLLPESAFLDSGKVQWLCEAVKQAQVTGSKMLVFSQFTALLDLLEFVLSDIARVGYRRLDGSTPVQLRQTLIDEFSEASAAEIPVMMLSTRAGGVGINLTAANTVVIFDSDWNPANDVQAEDRAHRISMTHRHAAVTVHRLLSRGTIEVHMAGLADNKHDMATALMSLSERILGRQATESAAL